MPKCQYPRLKPALLCAQADDSRSFNSLPSSSWKSAVYLLQDFRSKQRGAIFDKTRQYRYSLWRSWEDRSNQVAFILLNPSQANETKDDPTIRRCIGFAQAWGYSSVEIVNLFAYCATKVQTLKKARDPIGTENDSYLLQASERASLIVYAWGNWGRLRGRNLEVMGLLRKQKVGCLGLTNSGQPRHSLYLPKSSIIEPFDSAKWLEKIAKKASS